MRLREEKSARKLSEREIGSLIRWTQSKVAQKLSGRTPMTLDEFEALCFALSVQPTEMIRDRGLEFCAEMTPTELRLLERLRELTPVELEAIKTLIQVSRASIEQRGATKRKKLFGKPRA